MHTNAHSFTVATVTLTTNLERTWHVQSQFPFRRLPNKERYTQTIYIQRKGGTNGIKWHRFLWHKWQNVLANSPFYAIYAMKIVIFRGADR